ncbi:hypothetical protein STRCI_001347 [Streptomyces cinnabarinus]|uniref:Uncharacterized protein n=1 Tax=Streptomyces cinnabarinus TaxID=67287 RepID=A0ABY7KBV9_9ACTN|nr:hypothetical protein [Streptomyces cinnabarinus]WAZ20246.1 hypothetical protein STRCI_001347 [Streptomyces cinnabarinus]
MSARICRTAEEAFDAGWKEPCDHGVADPGECPRCGLTDAEIARLAALLSGLAAPAPATRAAA